MVFRNKPFYIKCMSQDTFMLIGGFKYRNAITSCPTLDKIQNVFDTAIEFDFLFLTMLFTYKIISMYE